MEENKLSQKNTETINASNTLPEEDSKEIIINNQYLRDKKNLSFGTIIFGHRFQTDNERLSIKKGHRVGPYIIIGYDNEQYICLYGSGNCFDTRYFKNDQSKILCYEYETQFSKTTYICMDKYFILKKEQIEKVLGELTDYDKKRLLKKLEILKHQEIYPSNFNIQTLPLEVGDIILYNNKNYLIINKEQNQCQIILISQKESDASIVVDNELYYIQYENIENVEITKEIERVGTIEFKELTDTLTNISNYLKEHILTRGLLIKVANQYYYVFNKEKNTYLAYQVLETVKDENSFSKFTIESKNYYCNFARSITINENNKNYKIISHATENEMDTIKKEKKSYTKKHNTPTKKGGKIKKYSQIVQGSVVSKIKEEKEEYIVLKRINNNEILTISEKDLLNKKYILQKFNIYEVKMSRVIDSFVLKDILKDLQENIAGIDNYINTTDMIDIEKNNQLIRRFNQKF